MYFQYYLYMYVWFSLVNISYKQKTFEYWMYTIGPYTLFSKCSSINKRVPVNMPSCFCVTRESKVWDSLLQFTNQKHMIQYRISKYGHMFYSAVKNYMNLIIRIPNYFSAVVYVYSFDHYSSNQLLTGWTSKGWSSSHQKWKVILTLLLELSCI